MTAAETGPAGARVPVDQVAVRRVNLARVLGEIRAADSRSRAAIAARTGLTKATVSSLVVELIERRLVRETGHRQEGTIGRPGRLLELDGRSVTALALEINAHYLAVRVVDLADRVLLDRRIGFDAAQVDAQQAISGLTRLAREAIAELGRADAELAGIGVAVPGLVDVPTGTVRYAPNLMWRDVPIAETLRAELEIEDDITIVVDNEANLSALAEFRRGLDTTPNLVYLTGEAGIGAGLIADGRLLRGVDGFSGEIGHIPVEPTGRSCGCGRIGCLETKVGLAAAIESAAPDLIEQSLDPEQQARALLRRAEVGEPAVLAGLDDVGYWLGVGVSILINMLNPGTIVLGGYFATITPYVVPAAMRQLRARVVAGDAAICNITASAFGYTAAVRGGTGVIIDEVFQDPTRARIRADSEVPLAHG